MKKNKVFIINDTRSELHHGCSRVMNNLDYLIKKYSGNVVGTSPVGLDWRKSELIKQKMINSDIVIVNGEGSIHHNSSAGIPLLEVASFCKLYGVRAILVNCLYQDMDNVASSLLNDFDFISVRDSFSQKQLSAIGVESKLLPDLTFYSSLIELPKRKRKGWMFTCSVNIEKSVALYKLSKKFTNSYYEPVVFGKGDWEKNVNISFWEKLSKFSFLNLLVKIKNRLRAKFSSRGLPQFSKTFLHSEYHNRIAEAEFLVSGRFHSVCFAINSLTPFVAITSNSHKIEALIHDFELSENRVVKSTKDIKEQEFLPFSQEEITSIKNKLDYFRSEFESFYQQALTI
ncbi:MAG: polysaccharide pyruvyl transferase family protein [Pseudoalteromonas distincta]|uniref:polysaccharide pyruvyl transferase family protein n=1 Tax=Pseudoalteromonas distincta TaxID=77608 RepID=UPI003F99E072